MPRITFATLWVTLLCRDAFALRSISIEQTGEARCCCGEGNCESLEGGDAGMQIGAYCCKSISNWRNQCDWWGTFTTKLKKIQSEGLEQLYYNETCLPVDGATTSLAAEGTKGSTVASSSISTSTITTTITSTTTSTTSTTTFLGAFILNGVEMVNVTHVIERTSQDLRCCCDDRDLTSPIHWHPPERSGRCAIERNLKKCGDMKAPDWASVDDPLFGFQSSGMHQHTKTGKGCIIALEEVEQMLEWVGSPDYCESQEGIPAAKINEKIECAPGYASQDGPFLCSLGSLSKGTFSPTPTCRLAPSTSSDPDLVSTSGASPTPAPSITESPSGPSTTVMPYNQCTAEDYAEIRQIRIKGTPRYTQWFDMLESCSKKALTWTLDFDESKFLSCAAGYDSGVQASCLRCFGTTSRYVVKNCKGACMFSSCGSSCLGCTEGNAETFVQCAGGPHPLMPQVEKC